MLSAKMLDANLKMLQFFIVALHSYKNLLTKFYIGKMIKICLINHQSYLEEMVLQSESMNCITDSH